MRRHASAVFPSATDVHGTDGGDTENRAVMKGRTTSTPIIFKRFWPGCRMRSAFLAVVFVTCLYFGELCLLSLVWSGVEAVFNRSVNLYPTLSRVFVSVMSMLPLLL